MQDKIDELYDSRLRMAEELLDEIAEKRTEVYKQIGESTSKLQQKEPQVIEIVDPKSNDWLKTVEETKFNILKGWAEQKGVIGMDQIVFPHAFSDNFSEADKKFQVNGVMAGRDFSHRESILAIPFDCLISPKTFQEEEPELYEQVIEDCPDLFDDVDCLDSETLLITFFIMVETAKGKTSKWYPYLQSLPQEHIFFCDWPNSIILQCQDPQLA